MFFFFIIPSMSYGFEFRILQFGACYERLRFLDFIVLGVLGEKGEALMASLIRQLLHESLFPIKSVAGFGPECTLELSFQQRNYF